MTRPKVFLHTGVAKAGSTFLQTELFPKLDKANLVNYAGVNYSNGILVKDDIWFMLETLAKTPEREHIDFDFNYSSRPINGEKNLLLSHQAFSTPVMQHQALRNFKATGFEIYPIIIIREQKALLRSLYLMYLRGGGVKLPLDFFNCNSRLLSGGWLRDEVFVREFDWLKQKKLLSALFGEERVLMLPIEAFKYGQKKRFLEELLVFLGIDRGATIQFTKTATNVGQLQFKDASARLKYNRARVFAGPFAGKLLSVILLKRHLQLEIENHFNELDTFCDEMFSASNDELKTNLDWDLAYLNYNIKPR